MLKMTVMKKILSTILVSVMISGVLCACGGQSGDDLGDVTLGAYKGVNIIVNQTDIDEEIRERLSDYKEVKTITKRAVQKGDVIAVSYSGTIDGKVVAGLSGVLKGIRVGDGNLLSGADKELVGVMKDESKSVTVTYPESYTEAPELSGKTVVYVITVEQIKEEIYPEITDNFVKEKLGFNTADEFKNDAKIKSIDLGKILNEIVAGSTASNLSESALKAKKDKFNEYYAGYAQKYYDCDFEGLLKEFAITSEKWNTLAERYAENEVKKELVINSIALAEKISVSDEEYSKGLEYYSEYYGYKSNSEVFLKDFGEENFNSLLLMEKVVAFIVDNANISVKGAE